MAESSPRVRILDAMAEGLVVFVTRFVSVLKIYIPAWLVVVAAIVVLDVVWFYNTRQLAYFGLRDVVWSIAVAPAILGLIVLAVNHGRPNRYVWYRWDQVVVLAAAVLAVWAALDVVSEWIGSALFLQFYGWYWGFGTRLPPRVDELSFWIVLAIRLLGWSGEILKSIWQLVAMGLLVSLACWGRMDLRWLWTCIRAQPVRWFAMSLAVVIFSQALVWMVQYLYTWAGLGAQWTSAALYYWQDANAIMQQLPRVDRLPGWRNLVLPLIANQVTLLPWALLNIIPILMMVRAFAPFVAEHDEQEA